MRILVVEDDAINLLYLETLLSRSEHAVDTAPDGRKAVDKVAASGKPYDLILMDIQMPEMDGLCALAHIHALGPGAAAIPVLALTGYARPEDLRALEDAGFAASVTKPFDVTALMEAIRRFSPQPRAAGE
jgi:CheY-like chemotaxis protein